VFPIRSKDVQNVGRRCYERALIRMSSQAAKRTRLKMGKEGTAVETVDETRCRPSGRVSSAQKVRMLLEGLRDGEEDITELCRREGVPADLYCCWICEFLEAGLEGLLEGTRLEGESDEASDLRERNLRLKEEAEKQQRKDFLWSSESLWGRSQKPTARTT
jgi:transposase